MPSQLSNDVLLISASESSQIQTPLIFFALEIASIVYFLRMLKRNCTVDICGHSETLDSDLLLREI